MKIAMNRISPIHIPQKIIFNDNESNKKINGIVVPIYYPENNKPCFIMFEVSSGKKEGTLEFLGGKREKNDKTIISSAVREAIEETAEYLLLSDTNLIDCPYKKVWSSWIFYIRVPNMENEKFQENLKIIKDNRPSDIAFLEMKTIVHVPIDQFLTMEYPKSSITVYSIDGKEYKVLRFAALCIFAGINENLEKIND